jgi:uncharacterized protein involved in exopolysaccharide biosynthesis
VNFTVSAPAPELAKALADSLLVALDNISISLRRERAAVERRFWLERAAAARQDVDSAERLLATYARRDPPSVRAGGAQPRLEETRVGRAVELAQQLYIEMRLREAQVAAQEARSTTALTVLRSPVLPAGPSHPRGSIAIAGGLIIGLSLGLSRIVLRR